LGTESHLDQIILACYNALELITFYTASGKKEARAWTLKKGSTCPQAGGKIHSDFEKKFIRADVINWDQLIKAGNWAKAKELGWLKTVGKDYVVVDGNVIEFKI
jgi:ribosome-binding ATPase